MFSLFSLRKQTTFMSFFQCGLDNTNRTLYNPKKHVQALLILYICYIQQRVYAKPPVRALTPLKSAYEGWDPPPNPPRAKQGTNRTKRRYWHGTLSTISAGISSL